MSSRRAQGARQIANRRMSELGYDSAQFYPQLWLLLVSLMIFGSYVAWDLRLFSLILISDKSYMATLIMALVLLMSVHCGWHILHTSRYSLHALRFLDDTGTSTRVDPLTIESGFLQRFVNDLSTGQRDKDDGADAIIEIHADAVRSPAELGWFFVDLAVRLGLLGTIIGFILIFASLDNIDIEGGDDLKNLLIAMSGGMGTALYTTLTGLIGASLLSFQYLILSRQSEHLIAQLLRIRRRLRDRRPIVPS